MKGPRLASMAWRNLWRNRRRTLLTLSSISFGTMLGILFTGIQDGNFGAMIDLAARMGGGHVTLQHPEYLDAPTLSRTVTGAAELERVALRDAEVERVVTRITGQIMLSTAAQNYGAGFIAFDPEKDDETTLSVIEGLVEGDVFESKSDRGIILGARLAENLDTRMGRKVVFTLTDKNGEIVRDVARVSGIIRTGAPTVDAALCLLPIDTLRSVLGYEEDEGVQVALFLGDQRSAEEVALRVGAHLGEGVSALTWKQTQSELAGFIAMKVGSAILMEIVIMILVAAGIFNTLFVSVMERVREFGIMMAIGFSPRRLFGLVMYESLWLAMVGLVGGAIVTAWPYWYMNQVGLDLSKQLELSGSEVAGVAITPIMRADIYPENLALIVFAVLAATLLAGVYPAWKAGRIEPVESIRLV